MVTKISRDIDDKVCPLRGKAFLYPSVLRRYLKLEDKCSIQINSKVTRVSDRGNRGPISDRVNPTTNLSYSFDAIIFITQQLILLSKCFLYIEISWYRFFFSRE